jgi:hypothetical protein
VILYDLEELASDQVAAKEFARGTVPAFDPPVGIRDQDRLAELIEKGCEPVALRFGFVAGGLEVIREASQRTSEPTIPATARVTIPAAIPAATRGASGG